MFEWNKKEAPLKALAGMGGGVGRGLIGGPGGIDATGGTKIPATDSGNGYNISCIPKCSCWTTFRG